MPRALSDLVEVVTVTKLNVTSAPTVLLSNKNFLAKLEPPSFGATINHSPDYSDAKAILK